MVEKTSDAIALWQEMIGEMQKGFTTFTKQALTPAARTERSEGAALPSAQRQLTELMESYLVGMNLPSRAQLKGMNDRLSAIEVQLVEIGALLRQMQGALPPAAASAEPHAAGSRRARHKGPPPAEAAAVPGHE